MKRIASMFIMIMLAVAISITPIFATTEDQFDPDVNNVFSNYFNLTGGVTRDESDIDFYYCPNENKNNERSVLPASVDLSTDNYFPSIGNQGIINSCSGWGATYYQFGYQVARMEGWNAKNNTNYQFSPKWTYNLTNSGENQSVDIIRTYDILKKSGAVRYSEFTPTLFTNENQNGYSTEFKEWCTNTQAMRNALNYRLDTKSSISIQTENSYTDTPITSYDSDRLEDMKSRLNNGQVLTFITNRGYNGWITETLHNQYSNNLNGQEVCIKNSNIFYYNPYAFYGHFLTIVGYDDSIWYDLNNNGTPEAYEKGAFKIADSKGTEAWNDGYIWVLYDSINKVSNVSAMNSLDRISTIDNYRYYAITVKKCPVDLALEVTIQQSHRNQIGLNCMIAPIDDQNNDDTYSTYLRLLGGGINFSGTGNTTETATFVFDYDNFPDDYHKTAMYGLNVVDDTNNNPTIIKKIQVVDSEGNAVYIDNEEKTIDATLDDPVLITSTFLIGLLGDIDIDDQVTILDAGKIQQYLADLIDFSDIEEKLADVDRDGDVTIMDSLRLQRYLAGLCNIGDSRYISLD